MKNKYAYRSHISEAKIRHIVRCFAADLTAQQAAFPTDANRDTVNRFFHALRDRIHGQCAPHRPVFDGANSNRAPQIAGHVEQGKAGGPLLFGIFEQDGRVYTGIVAERLRPLLRSIIRGKRDIATVANDANWPGDHGLADLGHGHFRPDNDGHQGAAGRLQTDGSERFRGLAKDRLSKFKGIPARTFHLHLKGTGWRYNHRDRDTCKKVLTCLREDPVNWAGAGEGRFQFR